MMTDLKLLLKELHLVLHLRDESWSTSYFCWNLLLQVLQPVAYQSVNREVDVFVSCNLALKYSVVNAVSLKQASPFLHR